MPDLVAARLAAVPRAPERFEGAVLVGGGKLAAGIKSQVDGRRVGGVVEQAGLGLGAVLGFGHLAGHAAQIHVGVRILVAVAKRPAVVLAALDDVHLFRRNVVAVPVAALVEAVEHARHRMPAEADGVAQAAGVDLAALAVGADAQHGRLLGVGRARIVVGAAESGVEVAVGAPVHAARAVLPGVGKAVGKDTRHAQAAVFGHVHHPDGLLGGHIQLAAAHRHAVRRTHVAGHLFALHILDLAVAVHVFEVPHVALFHAAEVDAAVRHDQQAAGIAQARRHHLELESGGYLEAAEFVRGEFQRHRLVAGHGGGRRRLRRNDRLGCGRRFGQGLGRQRLGWRHLGQAHAQRQRRTEGQQTASGSHAGQHAGRTVAKIDEFSPY